jgi:hypothetical protein
MVSPTHTGRSGRSSWSRIWLVVWTPRTGRRAAGDDARVAPWTTVTGGTW